MMISLLRPNYKAVNDREIGMWYFKYNFNNLIEDLSITPLFIN